MRHATDRRPLVDIRLKPTGVKFFLCITHNGEGVRPWTSLCVDMVLQIMKYRAGMIRATFEISPTSRVTPRFE